MPERPYLAEIEEFFISTIRKGLMLRAHDVDVIRDWEARGVPVAVVRRGILVGVRRFLEGSDPSSPLPSSLKYYRTHVEAEFETWRRASGLSRTFEAMRVTPRRSDPVERALAILADRAAGAATPDEARRFEAAAAYLRSQVDRRVGPSEALDDTDEFLVQAFLDAMPREVRLPLVERVRAQVDEAARRGLGPEALRDLERTHLRAAVREETGFEGLVALVVGTTP